VLQLVEEAAVGGIAPQFVGDALPTLHDPQGMARRQLLPQLIALQDGNAARLQGEETGHPSRCRGNTRVSGEGSRAYLKSLPYAELVGPHAVGTQGEHRREEPRSVNHATALCKGPRFLPMAEDGPLPHVVRVMDSLHATHLIRGRLD
jgi:hypothetical protein